jgi:hypothetical protein
VESNLRGGREPEFGVNGDRSKEQGGGKREKMESREREKRDEEESSPTALT